MQFYGKGILHLTIVEAKLTRETEFFSSQDPYVEFLPPKLDDQEENLEPIRSNTAQGGGKTPKWDYKTNFEVHDINQTILFNLYDEDIVSNDLIGFSAISVSSLLLN